MPPHDRSKNPPCYVTREEYFQVRNEAQEQRRERERSERECRILRERADLAEARLQATEHLVKAQREYYELLIAL